MAEGGSEPDEPVFAVVRGDLQINEVKLGNTLDGRSLRAMTDAEVEDFGLVAGSASPVGLGERMQVIADVSIEDSPNLVAGANRPDFHLVNVNHGRDWTATGSRTSALVEAGHAAEPAEDGTIGLHRGMRWGTCSASARSTRSVQRRRVSTDGAPVIPTGLLRNWDRSHHRPAVGRKRRRRTAGPPLAPFDPSPSCAAPRP